MSTFLTDSIQKPHSPTASTPTSRIVEKPHAARSSIPGLCTNCGHDATCTFPRATTGVWQCEEYA